MKNLLIASTLCAAVAIVALAGQAQTPAPQAPAPSADPYANNAAPGATQFPLAAPAGKDSGARADRARRCREPGAVQRRNVEVRPRVQPAGRLKDLESGEAQDDAGREGDGRHGVQRHRSGDLLRDGQRRLRLHLDRDAAQRRAIGKRSRACGARARTPRPFPASASPTPMSARSSMRIDAGALVIVVPTVDIEGRGDRGARLDLLPAARQAQPRRRPGLRRRDVGQRSRRLSQHDQRQHRADRDDRDARRRSRTPTRSPRFPA